MSCGIPVVHALSVDSESAMLDRLPCDRLALAGPYVRRANGVFPGIPLVQALSVDSVSATLAAARAIPILQTAATLRGSAAPHCLRPLRALTQLRPGTGRRPQRRRRRPPGRAGDRSARCQKRSTRCRKPLQARPAQERPLPESTPSETVRRVAMPASTPAMDPSELQSSR